jgi:hypothetical protein
MIYKNGYKVVYEVAADGKRTFYATKSNAYPPRDEAGNIIENEMNTVLATFDDTEFAGKTVYEYKGEFYVSTEALPKYKEDGTPADEKIKGFEKLFKEEKPEEPAPAAVAATGEEDTPAIEPEDGESEAGPEDEE